MGKMEADREVIEVRADERFDTVRLESYLRELLANTGGPFALAQFGSGHANLTYLIRFGDTEYVLRRPPLGPIAPSSHDVIRENRVLKDLWRVFPLAPYSYLVCEDEKIIGAPFHIMERRHGIAIRTQLPAGYDWTPTLNKRVGEMAIDVLADLHCVEPTDAGLGELGRPQGFVARQLAGWSKRWEAAKHQDTPAMSKIIGWLERGLPSSNTVSLLHNDYKLDNMLFAADDPGRVVAVLDWEMCTLGNPLMDLGYSLAFWSEASDDERWIHAASMPTWNPGFPSRDDFIERYARATGFDCGETHWYHVFGVFKITVILQQIYIRFLRQQTEDQRFSVYGDRVTGMIDKAQMLAKL